MLIPVRCTVVRFTFQLSILPATRSDFQLPFTVCTWKLVPNLVQDFDIDERGIDQRVPMEPTTLVRLEERHAVAHS
jgi:hypothetical protein